MKDKKKTSEMQQGEDMDLDDDVSQILLWSMKKPYEQYERELNENPETKDVKPSEELFERIVNNLKAQGEWEKESKLFLPDIYHMLSRKDREALAIGRKIQKIERKTILLKRMAIVACVVMCIFGVSITSGANRRYMIAVWNELVGDGRLKININVEDENNGKPGENSEEEAISKIKEELGISAIKMGYRPDGMVFSYYRIEAIDKKAILFYKHQNSWFTISMQSKGTNSKTTQEFDGIVVDEIVTKATNEKVKIWKINDKGEKYAAQLEGRDDYYVFQGYCSQKEFGKIIENIYFSI